MQADLVKLERICGEVDEQGVVVYKRKNAVVEQVEAIKEETRRRGEQIKLMIDKQVGGVINKW